VDLRRRTSVSVTPLWVARVAILLLAALVAVIELYLPSIATSMQRLQLGWELLGASLGPWLLVRLSGKRLRSTATLGALWTGFLLTLIFYAMPNAPGDFLERVLPFIAGLGIVLTGGEQRSDADRADRSAEQPAATCRRLRKLVKPVRVKTHASVSWRSYAAFRALCLSLWRGRAPCRPAATCAFGRNHPQNQHR